ncbi:MAG: SGNH/GDSL hydrolase family protein [Planctomycetes bacterium]|nr:SGNH/GDSL hydrolase family protein [Planctomycetota bacterium]
MLAWLRRRGPRTWALVVFLALAAAELGLASLGYGHRVPMVADARLGWRKLPNASYVDARGIAFRSNALGYRDRDWAAPAAPERSVLAGGRRGLRIAVLGDSLHYGPGVREEDVWTRRLETGLRHELGDDVLVMDFAVVGYVLEQLERVWQDQVRAWRPDVVVVGVNAWMARPMRFLDAPERGAFARLWDRSAVHAWLDEQALEDAPPEPLRWGPTAAGDARDADAVDLDMRRDPLGAQNDAAWRAASERLRGMRADLDGWGGALVLLSVPRQRHLLDDPPEWSGARYDAIAADVGARHLDLRSDFAAGMARLYADAEAAGGAALTFGRGATLDGARLAHADENLYLFSDPEHLSRAGHEIVARRVLAFLRAQALVPR